MAWRVVSHGNQTWHVHIGAERRPNENTWQLMLSFRMADAETCQCSWAPYPIQAQSKASVYAQAERISDSALAEILRETVA